jgi:hypothetical protein
MPAVIRIIAFETVMRLYQENGLKPNNHDISGL